MDLNNFDKQKARIARSRNFEMFADIRAVRATDRLSALALSSDREHTAREGGAQTRNDPGTDAMGWGA